jgi:hypothetical protein
MTTGCAANIYAEGLAMKRYKYVVLANPVDGREDEFNDWYTNQHLPDFLRIPGVVLAERFRMSDNQRSDGPFPWKYMAIYEIETNNIEAVIHELKTRPGTPDMPRSAALQQEGRFSCFFEPI